MEGVAHSDKPTESYLVIITENFLSFSLLLCFTAHSFTVLVHSQGSCQPFFSATPAALITPLNTKYPARHNKHTKFVTGW